MSHKATYWLATVPPKLITAGSFRVLFHLCDYHNGDKDPESACYPSQEALIERTGLSNGGLNKCLDALETAGLFTRKRSTIPGTAKRRTYYILGCDVQGGTMLTPQSGGSPNSTPVEAAQKLTPLLDEANSTFEGGKLHPSGEEPVKEPVKEECVSEKDTHTDLFAQFWEAHPRPNDEDHSEQLFNAAVETGSDPAHIVAAAIAYDEDNEGNGRQYLKMSDNWLAEEKWKNHRVKNTRPPPTDEAQRNHWACMVQRGVGFGLDRQMAEELVSLGMVTAEQVQSARGYNG